MRGGEERGGASSFTKSKAPVILSTKNSTQTVFKKMIDTNVLLRNVHHIPVRKIQILVSESGHETSRHKIHTISPILFENPYFLDLRKNHVGRFKKESTHIDIGLKHTHIIFT
jgi:hypothetical protein